MDSRRTIDWLDLNMAVSRGSSYAFLICIQPHSFHLMLSVVLLLAMES